MFRSLVAWLFVNDVTAGKSWYYPDLQPRLVQASREQVLDAIQRALEAGGDLWSVRTVDANRGIVEAEVRTPYFGFVDELTVRLDQPPGDSARSWIVIARSRSRLGPGDFGKNARNLRRFYRRLEVLL